MRRGFPAGRRRRAGERGEGRDPGRPPVDGLGEGPAAPPRPPAEVLAPAEGRACGPVPEGAPATAGLPRRPAPAERGRQRAQPLGLHHRRPAVPGPGAGLLRAGRRLARTLRPDPGDRRSRRPPARPRHPGGGRSECRGPTRPASEGLNPAAVLRSAGGQSRAGPNRRPPRPRQSRPDPETRDDRQHDHLPRPLRGRRRDQRLSDSLQVRRQGPRPGHPARRRQPGDALDRGQRVRANRRRQRQRRDPDRPHRAGRPPAAGGRDPGDRARPALHPGQGLSPGRRLSDHPGRGGP